MVSIFVSCKWNDIWIFYWLIAAHCQKKIHKASLDSALPSFSIGFIFLHLHSSPLHWLVPIVLCFNEFFVGNRLTNKKILERMMTARLWFLFSFSDTTKSFIEFHRRTTRNIESKDEKMRHHWNCLRRRRRRRRMTTKMRMKIPSFWHSASDHLRSQEKETKKREKNVIMKYPTYIYMYRLSSICFLVPFVLPQIRSSILPYTRIACVFVHTAHFSFFSVIVVVVVVIIIIQWKIPRKWFILHVIRS